MTKLCKSCGAKIFWRVTKNGKPIPLDAEPSGIGNLIEDGHAARHPELFDLPLGDRPLYTSHFATCPNAKEHRKKCTPRNGTKNAGKA